MPRLKRMTGAAGADEAGRGPLAGPVVAAAVVLPPGLRLPELNDSKLLSAAQREDLEALIRAKADWCVMAAERDEIDRLNILWASMEAMRRAVAGLRAAPSAVYVDGNRVPRGFEGAWVAVVKGDGRIAEIAAASILAKTERDRIMSRHAERYPQYGFDRHFGYPTPEHLDALRRHGPCPLHRRSFAPVQESLQGCLDLVA